jgi:putative chitinase
MTIRCLWGFVPRSVWDKLPKIMKTYDLNTREKLAHFLGQCKSESNFTTTVENLNYTAERLIKVFPRYFPNMRIAKQYAHNPQAIANKIYSNRMGNGNEASNQGYFYRGRGFLQLTGKSSYIAFSEHIGEDCVKNPDLVSSKYALESAGWYFKARLGERANAPLNSQGVKLVTGFVKGSDSSYKQRMKVTQIFGSIIDCTYTGKDFYTTNSKKAFR